MKWRENIIVKALAFTAAVAAFTATAIMGWYQLMNYDALWNDASPYTSLGYTCYFWLSQDRSMASNLTTLYERRDAGIELSLLEKRDMEYLEEQLDPKNTNLRWQLLRRDGTVLYGNTSDKVDTKSAYHWGEYSLGRVTQPEIDTGWDCFDRISLSGIVNAEDYDGICANNRWQSQLSRMAELARKSDPEAVDYGFEREDGSIVKVSLDTALTDDSGYTEVLRVDSRGELYVYLPTIRACLESNRFGYLYDAEHHSWIRDSSAETAGTGETVSLAVWVDRTFPVDDHYREAYVQLGRWHSLRTEYLILTVVLGAAGVLLMVYLCCASGHKKDVEGIYLNWFHQLPGDVLLFLLLLGGIGAMGIGIVAVHDAYMDAPMFIQLTCIGAAVSVTAALGVAALVTVCARCKAHTLLRNTWTCAILAWCWRVFLWWWGKLWELFGATAEGVRAVPLIWKAVMGCMAYTMFSILAFQRISGAWLLVTLCGAVYLCGWAYQWKKIRRGTQEIIGGNPNYHIDTRHMLPDLRGHADELNNLGHAISAAVEDRLKSEHFKAELITNVSHDLKTPLTSIINYVDLLKKEDIDNPKAQEYIEVLDRKSQRLKKLTEDLVEASKASTGNLTVSWERLDWAQLTDQALAETGDRLEAQKLTVVRSLPEEPMWVEADGRHLWRVLDNLLSNCAKYALPGTRVYVDLRRSGDWAVLSVKNISRDPLDIPADRLMERFVRGDESRNQAGSGLGLSIAQSLTELQHGRFEISIDGDLFKAIVTLPLAGERTQEPIQLIL